MALRQTIEEYQYAGARIAIGIDTGGPVGSKHVVSVAKDDQWTLNRWFFFDEWNESYAKNFAEKIASDEEYRSRSLSGDVAWKRVEDEYLSASREVYDLFQTQGLLGYRVGNREEKRAYREATRTMESLCESLFEGIRQRIRDPDSATENEPATVAAFERTIMDEAKTKAEEIAEADTNG